MMKKLLTSSIVALACFVLTAHPSHGVDRTEEFTSSLDARVPELLVRYSAPSAAVAIIHKGKTYTRSWGVADIETGQSPSDKTLYNVASISKLITTWAVIRLVQEGRVSLDAPISKYVSRWKLPSSPWNDDVTVRRLLSHTSGLSMPAVPQYDSADKVPTLEAMLSAGNDPVHLLERPGTSYGYSGGGFAILQLLVEEVTGERYDHYVETKVLKPIGMIVTSSVAGSNRFRAKTGQASAIISQFDGPARILILQMHCLRIRSQVIRLLRF